MTLREFKDFSWRLFHRIYLSLPIFNFSLRLKLFEMESLDSLRIRSDLMLLFRMRSGVLAVPNVTISKSCRSERLVICRVRTSARFSCFIAFLYTGMYSYKMYPRFEFQIMALLSLL